MSIKPISFSNTNHVLTLNTCNRYISNSYMTEEKMELIKRRIEKIKDTKVDLRRNFKAYTSEFDMDDLEDLYCSIPELDTEFNDEGSDRRRDTESISVFDLLPIFGCSSENICNYYSFGKTTIYQTTIGFDNAQTFKQECVYRNGIISA